MAPILTVENVGKSFGSRWALRNCSFSLTSGEVLGIMGRNGSGKTTLLRIIAGILQPTEGTVMTSERVGTLLDLTAGFRMDFTGRENLRTLLTLTGAPSQHMDHLITKAAEFADIGSRIDDPCRTWSAGMLLRVGFAAEIVRRPAILVVDESFAVGDGEFRRRCRLRLNELRREGSIIVIAGHDLDALAAWSTTCLWLHEGITEAIGPPHEVMMAYRDSLTKTTVNAAPTPPMAGGPEGFLHTVFIDDAKGNPATIAQGESFRLVIVLPEGCPDDIHVGVALRRDDGMLLWGSSTLREGFPPLPHPLPERVLLELPGGELLPGSYSFDVALMKDEEHYVCHRAEACRFTIEEHRQFGQVGVFNPRHRFVVDGSPPSPSSHGST